MHVLNLFIFHNWSSHYTALPKAWNISVSLSVSSLKLKLIWTVLLPYLTFSCLHLCLICGIRNITVLYHRILLHMTTARLMYAIQRLTCRTSAGAFVFFTSIYAGTLHAFSVVSRFVLITLQLRGTTNLVIICIRDVQVPPSKPKICSRVLKLGQRGGKI